MMDESMFVMDEATRIRYRAWVRRKIFRRIILPMVLLFALLSSVIIGLRSFGSNDEANAVELCCDETNDSKTNDPDETSEYAEINNSNETNRSDDLLTQAVIGDTSYQDFDFSTYNEYAIIEIDAAYLNSYLILVNKVFRLPDDYSPEDLVLPEVLSAWGHENTNHRMREAAARALEDMFGAAYEEEGLILWVASGYRSFEEQANKHQYFVDTYGYEEAEYMSARPGHSEHQTGLVVDVTAASVGALLTEEFANEPEGIWLRDNAHKFGFIIRYPYGRMNLTGVGYEPWHFRYVGISAATYIFENDIVLEQYIFPLQDENTRKDRKTIDRTLGSYDNSSSFDVINHNIL